MSRRARNNEYYEEDLYEEESDTYRRPRRSRRERFAHEDELQYGRRMSAPLPVEELDRLHIRERSKPDFIRESFDPPRNPGSLAVMREREESEMNMPPRETLRGYERDRREPRERRDGPRHRRIAKEEDLYFQEELGRRRYTGDESEEAEVELRRERRSIPRRDLDGEEEFVRLRRDKRGKKGSRMKHSELEIEQDELYHRAPDARREHTRLHSDVRERTPAARLQPRFHRHTDGDEEEEEDIIIRRDERRRGRKGRFKEKEEIIMRETRISTSPESPSSREISQVRKSHVTSRERMSDGYEIPRPPRAPSPELSSPSSFEELEIRHRTRGRPAKEKIIIERRNDVSPPSILSSESDNKSENEIDITHAKFKTSNRQEDVLIMERQPQRHESDKEVQVFEEEQYTRRDAGGAQRRSTPAVTVEDKAIIRFDSGGNGNAEQEMRRERRVSTKRSRSMNNRERLSDENIDRKRGQIGRRYIGVKDKRDRLWTEITKDLIVKEAIERAGYEYEETESFYYIFSYLRYDDISALVELSEDIRRARRQRIQEINRERASMRLPFVPEPPVSPAPVLPGRPPSPRLRARDERRLKKERELIIEEGRWRPAPAPLDRW